MPAGNELDHVIRGGTVVGGLGLRLNASPSPVYITPDAVGGLTINGGQVGNQWRPAEYGLISWAYDPSLASAANLLAAGGTVYGVRLKVDQESTITNTHVIVTAAGVTLTAGQCFAAVYQNNALLGTTASQDVAWTTTGFKTMALASPVVVARGDVTVAFFANGTTLPTLARTTGSSFLHNLGLATPNFRYHSADTGRTTTMPATLGAQSGLNVAYWAAVS